MSSEIKHTILAPWVDQDDLIRSCARGKYQAALLRGEEAWSGASIGTPARKDYYAQYYKSRRHLFDRVKLIFGACELMLPKRRKIVFVGTNGKELAWKCIDLLVLTDQLDESALPNMPKSAHRERAKPARRERYLAALERMKKANERTKSHEDRQDDRASDDDDEAGDVGEPDRRPPG